MSDCWFMPSEVADQRVENRLSPNRPSDYETLAALGVNYRRFDPKDVSDDTETFIKPLLAEMGYHAFDVIEISPEVCGEDKFATLATLHFQEHLHEDDEVRLILEGSGYFDVRGIDDAWIRLVAAPGDCIVLPAGIYHRFTTDTSKYIKTLRLFRENPRWLALTRTADEGEKSPARKQYLERIHGPAETIAGPALGPSNGVFSISFPSTFDDELSRVVGLLTKEAEEARLACGENKIVKESESAALVLYVTGAASAATKNESWCPDCVAAKPSVRDGFKALREKCSGPVFFVEAPVQRPAYKGNPQYPYRTHECLHIRGVPTVFVYTLKDGAIEEARREEGKTLTGCRWAELLDLRVRTEEPTVALLSQF